MSKYFVLCLLVSLAWCGDSLAQGSLKNKVRGAILRGSNSDSGDSSNDKRFDFEGAVWEFKVIDRKEKDDSKKTKMSGRLRIKQNAIFAIGDIVETGGQADKKKAGSNLKGQLKETLSKRLENKNAGEGERVGDLSKKSSKEYVFKFDQDDDYPLSGRAELKPDSKDKGGVWFGKYVEYLEGNKKQSWRMELRKIDE